MVNKEAKEHILLALPEVTLASYMNDEGQCWPHRINNERYISPTRETNNTPLIKFRYQARKQTFLF
jgi:hypothetical protein